MPFNRCYGCMRELEAPGAVCPHCGFDNTNGPRSQKGHALPCGSRLHGKYVIGKMLGQGGFGVTYIGWDLALETAVCIKEYFPNGAAMRDSSRSTAVYWSSGDSAQELRQGQESFLKEARKAVRLRNLPSVVTVWDVFQDNQTAYIVMDYIEGETLKNWLIRSGKPMRESACVELLAPIMRNLDTVHKRGIVHRDISPDNLMLQEDGSIVLLDFGAAKDLSRGSGQSSFVVAKRGYSPLEQYTQDSEIGPWTDVYAMCATIVYCVTGRLLPEAIKRVMGRDIDLSAFSPAVAQVLEKGLALKGEDRIQNMSELLAELQTALKSPEKKTLEDASRIERERAEKERLERERIERERLEQEQRYCFLGKAHYDKEEYALAMEYYSKAAETGNASAMNEIGYMYQYGLGVTQNYGTAMEWYKNSAVKGNADAMSNIGYIYRHGLGVTQDYDAAMEWYKKSADEGNAAAMNNIGHMYDEGLGVAQDYSKAMEWYQKSADNGVVTAMYNIAYMYHFGQGVKVNYKAAMEWYQKAADKGDASAMFNIASMYENGEGVDANLKIARQWYRKAAARRRRGRKGKLG